MENSKLNASVGRTEKIPHRFGSKRNLGDSQKEHCVSQHLSLYVRVDVRPLKIMNWEKHKAIPQRSNTGSGPST